MVVQGKGRTTTGCQLPTLRVGLHFGRQNVLTPVGGMIRRNVRVWVGADASATRPHLSRPFWTRFWTVQNLQETPVIIGNLKPQRCSILDTLRQLKANRMKAPAKNSKQDMKSKAPREREQAAPQAIALWTAGASEARPRFGSARNLARRARRSKAPSTLRSAGALHIVVPVRCAFAPVATFSGAILWASARLSAPCS